MLIKSTNLKTAFGWKNIRLQLNTNIKCLMIYAQLHEILGYEFMMHP